ncbi:Amino acid permease [Aspergillus sclerotialis]|uniref:Amino acid permease n=1 Tax=Aspergillus sclerotialis TaxID=2070753 RepID=A0A3A2ZQ30_9EURO|nr:Amino acid permease [Aspergillus sclerotialis]
MGEKSDETASYEHALAEKASVAQVPPEHLKKRYNLLSVIALAFTTTNSWVAFASGVAVPLECGRGPGIIYGLIAAGVIMGVIGAGFAELASAFPSAGGQYHIVFMVFPSSTRRVAAFFVGWVTIIYIMAALASCNFFVASSVFDTVSLWVPSYKNEAWHTYLLHIALCIVAFFATSRFPAAIGRLGIGVFFLSLAGFIASIVTLLTRWGDGFAMIIGITSCLWAYSGVDGPTHLAEEVPKPSRNVPIAIFLTIGLGIITVVAWIITLLFVVKDVDKVIESAVPILEVYNQALGSKVATTIWSVYYMVMFYEIVLNLFIFGGRTVWSLSRDGGILFPRWFAHLEWGSSPVRATAVMLVLEIIIGVLYVASSAAYNSFINLTLFALNITTTLPQAVLLFRGRGILPERAFSLGKFGPVINLTATLFVILFSVTFCFPTEVPVTPSSMNYLVVVMAIALMFPAAFWWGGLKKTFTGPQDIIQTEYGFAS